jgi:hypothetical protein
VVEDGMDWTYPEGSGDSGIFEIGRRLAEALGRAPDATRFTYDPRGMLRTTREIEQAALGGRLLVGFQTASKLQVEAERYQKLLEAGTDVIVWAVGARPDALALSGFDYRAIPADTRRLENQWFLVTDRPQPLAFVSYELGDPETFGVGGAASPGKRFVGFVSDDPGVVDLLIHDLTPIAVPPPPPEPTQHQLTVGALITASEASVDGPAPGAADGAVLVPVGRGADRQAFITALALARREGRDLVLIDRSAEGFVSPYTDLRGDDAGRPSPDRLFDASFARRDGRGTLAAFLEAASQAGVKAGAWFPTRSGAEGLAECARRFGGAVVVLPPDASRPSFAERLRGMTPDKLRAAISVPVIIADAA